MLQEEKDQEFDLWPSKLLQHWMSDISEDNVVKLNFTESHKQLIWKLKLQKFSPVMPFTLIMFFHFIKLVHLKYRTQY